MKTKAVYVLTSSPEDFYYEQLFMSVFTLKHYNPQMPTVLVTDEQTNLTFGKGRENLKRYFDKVVVVSIPEKFNQVQRSRFLKTSLIKYVEGDFLFIDTDTIIADSLEVIDECPQDIGMVLDKLNINKLPLYYNSGVIYVKHTPIATRFFETWHREWLNLLEKGEGRDQFSLHLVTSQYQNSIHTLPTHWNCQVKADSSVDNAKIFHLFTVLHSVFFILEDPVLLKSIKYSDDISDYLSHVILSSKEYFKSLDYRDIQFHRNLIESRLRFLLRHYPNTFKVLDAIAGIILSFIGIKSKICKNIIH